MAPCAPGVGCGRLLRWDCEIYSFRHIYCISLHRHIKCFSRRNIVLIKMCEKCVSLNLSTQLKKNVKILKKSHGSSLCEMIKRSLILKHVSHVFLKLHFIFLAFCCYFWEVFVSLLWITDFSSFTLKSQKDINHLRGVQTT